MKAIIIGAGRGKRLMPTTADTPKCLAEVRGRRILDWILEAFSANGITRIAFIGGYQAEKVRSAYPGLIYYYNSDWERNNILVSLMCAEAEMDEPFVSCYSDTLFTPEVVGRLLESAAHISLLVDTDWKARYTRRTHHPSHDAEKIMARNGRITRIHRDIDESLAHGEFTGMAKFSVAGAVQLRQDYHRCLAVYAGKPFREAIVFEKAYLIHLFQEMIEDGVPMAHVDATGGYMEIDTQQDYEVAQGSWIY